MPLKLHLSAAALAAALLISVGLGAMAAPARGAGEERAAPPTTRRVAADPLDAVLSTSQPVLGAPPRAGDPTAPPPGTPGARDLGALSSDNLLRSSGATGEVSPEADPDTLAGKASALKVDTPLLSTPPSDKILGLSTTELSLGAFALLAVVVAVIIAFRRRA